MHPIIYFPLYEKSKIYFKENWDTDNPSDSLSPQYVLICATTCKTITSALTYPHEVVRARMQDVRKYEDTKLSRKMYNSKRPMVVAAIRQMRKEGYHVFYSGFFTNLARLIPNYAITFVLYEALSDKFHEVLD